MAVANSTPFAIKLRIYPGGNPIDASTWGVGEDISAYVRYPGSDGGQPISYSAGRGDEAAQVDASRMDLTLDNRDGRFSTHNPNGPYYGLLTRNTPISLGMINGEDDFGRTVAGGLGTSSGGNAWTSGASWSVTGSNAQAATATADFITSAHMTGANAHDFDTRVTVWPSVAATGAALVYGILGRSTSVSTSLMFTCEFNTGGQVDAKIWRNSASAFVAVASAPGIGTYVANDKWRIRAQADGSRLRLKVWKPATPSTPDADEPDAWTVTATDNTITDSRIGLAAWRVVGNTNAGTVNFAFDDFVSEVPEFVGTVVQWPVRWDKTGRNCWAPIQAAGILRRLQQGSGLLQPPLERQLSGRSDMTGYWPLSDGSNAVTFGSARAGVNPASYKFFTPAAESSLPGGSVAPTSTDSLGRINGYTPFKQTGSGFSALFFSKLTTLPSATQILATFVGSGAGIYLWQILIDNAAGSFKVRGIDSGGAVSFETTTLLLNVDLTEWVAWNLDTDWSGGTVNWTVTYHQVTRTDYLSQSGSFGAGSAPRCQQFQLGGQESGTSYAHVWLGENTLPFVDYVFQNVANGWTGETAADRIERVCGENSIPVSIEAGDTAALGAQRPGTLIDTLRQAADADYGVLYELGNGLGYRPREARYNQDVLLSLSVAAGQVAEPPEPINDDQKVRNDWTVTRQDGSFARVYDQEHIDTEGHYPDSATINVETDAVLADNAGWRLYLGTRPELRWPAIDLDLARNASLISTWRQRQYGFRMQVTTGLTQIAGSDPDVIVEGYSAMLWPHGWRITMNCSSATAWDTLAVDDASNPVRMDTEGSHLDTAVTSSATSWVVVTDSGPIWSPTSVNPGDVPFVLACEGEHVTVTNVGDLSGGTQTLTVTRATNGVSKAHDAGAKVALAYPTYMSL